MKTIYSILMTAVIACAAMGCGETTIVSNNGSGGSSQTGKDDPSTGKHDPDEGKPSEDPSTPGQPPSNPGQDPSNPGQDPSNPGQDPSNPGQDPSNPGQDPSEPATDPSLDPNIPRDVVGGLVSWLEDYKCNPEKSMCDIDILMECKDDHYYVKEECLSKEGGCVDGLGCVMCIPESKSCVDNDVYICAENGQTKTFLASCGLNGCVNGECLDDNCPVDAQFIYLVDSSYNLIRFNPGDTTGNPFNVLFKLNCGTTATPFSMAVDRLANAWVLFNNGVLYKVNTANPSPVCELVTDFRTNGLGLSTFGMAFSLDTIGGSTDTLFIGDTASGGHFGRIATEPLGYKKLASFPVDYEETPELTGTGRAKLYAFAPGWVSQHISELDKDTGDVVVDYPLAGAGGNINAWAFAHWGGMFFIFETVDGQNRILRFNPTKNELVNYMLDTPYRVVGAGVSTCAPVEEVN